MKPVCIALLMILIATLPSSAQVTVTITNTTAIAFTDKVVEIPWEAVKGKWSEIDTNNLIILNTATKKEISFQLEYHGNTNARNILVQVTVPAGKSVSFQLKTGNRKVFLPQTYCRYVPERKDDFAWENDKIAFRMYGRALEGTSEDAYGMDVWTKRTTRLIINERYKRGEYHVDHGDGMDYYHVGYSLGAGNIAPYIGDSIWYSKNYHDYKILDNGPLRSTFQLIYDGWNASGIQMTATKTISLDAGSQLNRVEASYQYADTTSLPLAIGIVKRSQHGELLLNEKNGVMAYWEPQHGEDGVTGVATITASASKMLVNDQHLLSIAQTHNNIPLVYYTGAAWNKAGVIINAGQWFEYVNDYAKQLQQPLKIEVK
ncbi:MAG TPA: DUF4861 family protein [Agriterribacter sp.]|nr:DUF4861 family protein [Agriterribacter sp.]